MKTTEIAALAGMEIAAVLKKIEESQTETLLDAVCGAKKVYVYGVGRSLLMLRGLAMRLMHAGLESYVVGDTTTPAFEKEDILILASGSGETAGLINTAKRAKQIGGKVALITASPRSALGRMSDILIEIPVCVEQCVNESDKEQILPGGSLFEQCTLVLGDAAFLSLARREGIPRERLFARHANLE